MVEIHTLLGSLATFAVQQKQQHSQESKQQEEQTLLD
jgi:hypothetical protein